MSKENKLIVFITGLPGTGKSYACNLICQRFPQFIPVSYDRIKELFWDTYGFDSHEEKVAINDRSLEFYYRYLDEQMNHHNVLLAEYPFCQRQRDELARLVRKNGFNAVTVCLEGDLDVIYDRQKNRDEHDPRHPGHLGDVYHVEEYEKYVNGPHYDYTKEQYWQLHSHKDYHLHIGREFDIDVTDFSKIGYEEVIKEIERILEDNHMNKLIEMSEKFPQTVLWTDSFSVEDHRIGLENGMRGVTTSPTWVSKMMCLEPLENHRDLILMLHHEHPEYNEAELTWAWTLQMGRQRSRIMLPLWKKGNPHEGRFSIQTSIYEYNNYDRILQMAREVNACGPNMQVKIPCTENGIKAIEQATYEGISCMGTQCYSVDQALAAAEAVERALNRREKEGLSNDMLNPMIALLPGMQDDAVKANAEKNGLTIHPDALNWAGIAVAKKTMKLLQERNYRIRPLIAYYRSMLHWTQFIGADVALSIPMRWQKRFVCSDAEIRDYYHDEIEPWKIEELKKIPLFVQAYEEGSTIPADFVHLDQVVSTFRYFTTEYQKAVEKVRDICLADPTK